MIDNMMTIAIRFVGGQFDGQAAKVMISKETKVGDVLNVQGHEYKLAPGPSTEVVLRTQHENLMATAVYCGDGDVHE